jgi:hypothetical protein
MYFLSGTSGFSYPLFTTEHDQRVDFSSIVSLTPACVKKKKSSSFSSVILSFSSFSLFPPPPYIRREEGKECDLRFLVFLFGVFIAKKTNRRQESYVQFRLAHR